jgi:succinate dehydrogenase / fumarate reductase cytochrome b subunit
VENRRARPTAYRRREIVKATLAARTMVMSGLILLTFIVYHLLHFTFRTTDPRFPSLPMDPLGHYDVYSPNIPGRTNS